MEILSQVTKIKNGLVDRHFLEVNGLVEDIRYPRWSMYLDETMWCPMECLPTLCPDLVDR